MKANTMINGILLNEPTEEEIEAVVPKVEKACNKAIKVDSVKESKGKLPMHLILWKPVKWLVRIRMYGLKKYPNADNWKGIPKLTWYDALIRHLVAYAEGEMIDKESGLPHLAHSLCNLCYLIENELDEPRCDE